MEILRRDQKFVKRYPVPVAPLSEQQRIVERIESLFTKLDDAKEKVQEALGNFETNKVSILRKAFSGELTKQWRIEQCVSASDWDRIQLKDCGDWFGGGTPSTSKTEYWDNGNIPWITSKDMKYDNIIDTQLHITKEGIENSSAVYCDKPAVLFVMRSGILRRKFPVCMVSVPFTVNKDLKAVIPNDKISQRYLFWVCTAYERDIREKCMKSGTTVESIETKKLLTYSIPLASIKEQAEIVRILDDFFAKEAEAKEKVDAILATIDTMKKSILAKAFCGELGTNNLKDVLTALRLRVKEAFSAMELSDDQYISIQNSIKLAKKGNYVYDYNAPVLVVVANRRGYPNAIADSACALQNMMLAAESMGIGSCWINQLHWLDDNQLIRDYLETLGLGSDETICGAVALGNYDGTHARKPRTGMKVDYVK